MSTLFSYWVVATGGAAGAICRFMITGRMMAGAQVLGMPIGILAVNLAGSALMGVLVGYVAHLGTNHNYSLHLMIATGFLGGLTTFSTFALEISQLIQRDSSLTALTYALISVVGSVVLLFISMWITKAALNG